jgi:copper(I)-binding protein
MIKRLSVAAALAFAAVSAVLAAPHSSGIVPENAWSRPTPPGVPTGVGYVTIVNHGREPDRLIGATSPWAASASLHRSAMRGGVMSMQPVPEGLPIPPGVTLRLEPSGYHLMLTGLKRPLRPGDRIPATLILQKAGKLPVRFEVRLTPPV